MSRGPAGHAQGIGWPRCLLFDEIKGEDDRETALYSADLVR